MIQRPRKTRATPVASWPPQALVNAEPGTLALVSEAKLAAVAQLWRRRWGWSVPRCRAKLQQVRQARQEALARKAQRSSLRIAQRAYTRSLPGSTEPEVIAFIRAECTPNVLASDKQLEADVAHWHLVNAQRQIASLPH